MIAMPIDAMWECWAILTGPITCFIWPTRGPGANQTVRGRCFFLLPGCSPFCTFGAFRAFRTICRTLKRLMISVNPHTYLTYLQYSAICCGVQVHTLRILKIKPISSFSWRWNKGSKWLKSQTADLTGMPRNLHVTSSCTELCKKQEPLLRSAQKLCMRNDANMSRFIRSQWSTMMW